MIYVAAYLGLLAIVWAFIRGATARQSPVMRVAYPDHPTSESSGCESSSNEMWDGADATGPAPCP